MQKLGTLALLLVFAAIPARGQELIFGANVGARWDSNVFTTSSPESDFLARMGPEARLRETQGDLTYDIDYTPNYQLYSRFASLDDWDQLVNTTISYELGLTTSLTVRDLFEYAPTAANFVQQLTSPTGVPLGTQTVTVIGRYTTLVNSASIDLHHGWSERWVSDATLSSQYYDPKVQGAITSNLTSASGNLLYALSPTDSIGGTVVVTAQQAGSTSVRNATTSYFYNAAGVWNHVFSPTWSLNMQAGPTYREAGSISTPSTVTVSPFPAQSVSGFPALIDFKNCPKLPNGTALLDQCGPATLLAISLPPLIAVTSPTQSQLVSTAAVPIQGFSQGSQSSITYFANLAMTKRWENVSAILSYTRSAGTTSVVTSGSTVDTASASVSWDASPVWTTSVSVAWSDQSAPSNSVVAFREIVQPFPYNATILGTPVAAQTPQVVGLLVQQQNSSINIYQWILGLHSQYRLTKRLSMYGNFFYLNQTSSQSGGQALNLSSLNIDATRIELGFHYEFDPIHL